MNRITARPLRTRRVGAALAAAGLVTATLVQAPAASAQKVDQVAIQGARVVFYPTGETLYLWDEAADGHHVTAYFDLSKGSVGRPGGESIGDGTMWDYNGNGTYNSISFNIPESGWMKVKVCVSEGNVNVRCSAYHQFSAAN